MKTKFVKFYLVPVIVLCVGVICRQTAHANKAVLTNGPSIDSLLMSTSKDSSEPSNTNAVFKIGPFIDSQLMKTPKEPSTAQMVSKGVLKTEPSYEPRQSSWPEDIGTYFNQKPSYDRKGSVNKAELKDGPTISSWLMSISEELKSQHVFDRMKEKMANYSSLNSNVDGVIVGNILKNGKVADTWTANLKTGEIYQGEPRAGLTATTTFSVDDDDLHKLATGGMKPHYAIVTRKLKLGGDKKVLTQLLAVPKE